MTTDVSPIPSAGIFASFGSVVRAVAWFFGALGSANETAREYERLRGLSAGRLESLGLTVEDLPAEAYRRGFGA